jgi:PadR family transcriptional regulator PadR
MTRPPEPLPKWTRICTRPGNDHAREPIIESRVSRTMKRSTTKKSQPLGTARTHILLALEQGPLHGYGIRRWLDERWGGAVLPSPGTLYEALTKLERDGHIEEVPNPDPVEVEHTSRWRFYRILGLGRNALAVEALRLRTELSHLESVLGPVRET